ncbi:MAG TPA: hypothetical protein ENN56_00385 [Firmicutes bacterium]|nr:hypothetical protein [Bacillota bacterium]
MSVNGMLNTERVMKKPGMKPLTGKNAASRRKIRRVTSKARRRISRSVVLRELEWDLANAL